MKGSTILLLACFVLGLGCGGSDGDGGGTAGSAGSAGGSGGAGTAGASGGNGTTACGNFAGAPKQCIPGQYCKDETLSICESGCLSDTNCASNQRCDKSAGGNVGTCQNVASKDCNGFVSKCRACNPSATEAQCAQQCQQLSSGCVTCLVDINCWEQSNCNAACGL